jgi:hypothetical protein
MHQIKFKRPEVKVYENGNLELLKDWKAEYNGWTFTAQKGFISDGNSVPWLFRGIVPKFGRNTIAGIVHDWLYKAGWVEVYGLVADPNLQSRKYMHNITRRQADIARLDFCRWCGDWWVSAYVSYIGLRLGGWMAWKRYRRLDELKKRMRIEEVVTTDLHG